MPAQSHRYAPSRSGFQQPATLGLRRWDSASARKTHCTRDSVPPLKSPSVPLKCNARAIAPIAVTVVLMSVIVETLAPQLGPEYHDSERRFHRQQPVPDRQLNPDRDPQPSAELRSSQFLLTSWPHRTRQEFIMKVLEGPRPEEDPYVKPKPCWDSEPRRGSPSPSRDSANIQSSEHSEPNHHQDHCGNRSN